MLHAVQQQQATDCRMQFADTFVSSAVCPSSHAMRCLAHLKILIAARTLPFERQKAEI